MAATLLVLVLALHLSLLSTPSTGQLVPDYYAASCPALFPIVRAGVSRAVQAEQRLAASLLRLHFHDCFVNGCDGSILLDDTPSFVGEKTATPNRNSARGFEVIDFIKQQVEAHCPGIVSCADVLALVARESVVQSGGPSWDVLLGRRDSLDASKDAANRFIPPPTSDLPALVSAFRAVGLSASDLIPLAGAHTIGAARCTTFSQRLYNQSGTGQPDPNISPFFLASLQQLCPADGSTPNTLARLDARSPTVFDNSYYVNLQFGEGLLHSDEVLFSMGGSWAVIEYANDQDLFFGDFVRSMLRMGNLRPLTGSQGEIRTNCRFRNNDH